MPQVPLGYESLGCHAGVSDWLSVSLIYLAFAPPHR
jgi:hypothetical protein